jgi:hypothetical protein
MVDAHGRPSDGLAAHAHGCPIENITADCFCRSHYFIRFFRACFQVFIPSELFFKKSYYQITADDFG